MRLAVVTAVLLLVCILDTVTARYHFPKRACLKYPKSCGGGWRRIDPRRCAKVFWSKTTFRKAQRYCRSTHGGNLVSIHNKDEMMNVRCLTSRIGKPRPFWIGLRKTGNPRIGRKFRYTDGSEFKYTKWYRNKPNNRGGKEHCVVSNFKRWGYWNAVRCSAKKYFMCAKNM